MGSDLFCTMYPRWKEGGKIIFENDSAYSIFSVTPATPGHAIVVSKPHVERMEQLIGSQLESFVESFSGTISNIQAIYDSDPDKILRFYRSLIRDPPVNQSVGMAERMLKSRFLLAKPDDAYNAGINVGCYAGQSVNHLHVQLFPRRGKGLGIVAAMEAFFESSQ